MTGVADVRARAALVAAMQDNYIAYFRQFAGLPHVRMVESAEATWFVAEGAPGQYILRTRFHPETARSRIAHLLHTLERLTHRARWLVFETSTPAELPQLLTEAGLSSESGSPWLTTNLQELPPTPAAPDAFHVERVYDAVTLERWMDVFAAGYGMSRRTARVWYDAYLAQGFALDAASIHLLGYLEREPVAVATLLLSGAMAGIFDVATPSRFRRLGLASSLTHTAMTLARSLGYRPACLQSSAMGYNIYRRLGFDLVFFEDAYEWWRA